MKYRLRRALTDESGATAIEYGLIAAGIAVAIITIVFTLGEEIQNMFTDVNTQLKARGK
ncbi:MAG: Flp family type IVb pilin [Rhodospirillales bacterium]|nr:Flp family type IVb pilin [Rhodospirillales bacterium]